MEYSKEDFREQYEVMKNEIIQTGRFGLDGKV